MKPARRKCSLCMFERLVNWGVLEFPSTGLRVGPASISGLPAAEDGFIQLRKEATGRQHDCRTGIGDKSATVPPHPEAENVLEAAFVDLLKPIADRRRFTVDGRRQRDVRSGRRDQRARLDGYTSGALLGASLKKVGHPRTEFAVVTP